MPTDIFNTFWWQAGFVTLFAGGCIIVIITQYRDGKEERKVNRTNAERMIVIAETSRATSDTQVKVIEQLKDKVSDLEKTIEKLENAIDRVRA